MLIQPSYKECVKTLFSIYNTDEGIGFKPPIGLLYIATVIKKQTPHTVDIIDCQLNAITHQNILDFVAETYDVIGISAWTDFWYQAYMMGNKLKTKFPKAHLVMGGPHINIFPQETLDAGFIDSIIMGDGEIPMSFLLDNMAHGKNVHEQIPGVYFSGIRYDSYIPYICKDLDSLPIPDRSLLPIDKYTSVLSPNDYVTTMITSRGCPYSCVYCKLSYQKPVSRSAESVVKEFEAIQTLGIKEIEIYDDTFNWHHSRTIDICNGIIDKRIDIKWSIRDRVDKVTEEVLEKLKKAGCYRIHLGIETGSERVMKLIKKRITIDQARSAVKAAKRHKFTILTYFMFGLPGETVKEAEETLELALELNTDYAEFSIMIPYPGTEAYQNALITGVIPVDYWREFAEQPVPSFNIPYVIENEMSREYLIKLRDHAIKKFYFRVAYMIRTLLKIRSKEEFLKKFYMGLGLLNILRGKFKR